MSFSGSDGAVPGFSLKKFESQSEVEEKKKKRQEEWEKVRKPNDPEECPEEPIDNRCLYDKLEEQRLKKQEEFEEKVAFRNQVRRLDADETDFLDFCTERQQEIHQERKQEEENIISEMQSAKVIKIHETKTAEEKKSRTVPTQAKKSQSSLLAGAVKRKRSEEAVAEKKAKKEETDAKTETLSSDEPEESTESSSSSMDKKSQKTSQSNQLARVIGVLPRALPGLTEYDDSSDSVSSSSDSEIDFSLSSRNHVATIIRQQIQQQQQ